MRRLIESLTPGDRSISWTLIGAMFAFYVAVMTAATTVYVGHRTGANLAHEAGTTVATAPAQPCEAAAMRSLHHLARSD